MTKQLLQTDLLVIGGGASGLAAAIAAKRICGDRFSVCIAEQNPRVGKKILVTGNGRCNLGNTSKNYAAYHGSLTAVLPEFLSQTFSSKEFFQTMGLYCREETDGRLYPHSNQASSVLDTLRLTTEAFGISVCCNCHITGIQQKQHTFFVQTSDGTIIAKAVIVATGGFAAPKTGSDGNAMKWLSVLGHHETNLSPALVAFQAEPKLLRTLKGIRISATVSALDAQENIIGKESGEVQFTENALSGICIMNLSARLSSENPTALSLNLLSHQTSSQTQAMLWELYSIRTQWRTEDWLTGLFPKKVGIQLLRSCKIPTDIPVYQVTPFQLERLSQMCHDWRFPVISRGNWQNAQVTAGGIPLEQLRKNSLESKWISGLFFSGEILDLHGECGGYNLNWAWCSGQYAGMEAVAYLKNTLERTV